MKNDEKQYRDSAMFVFFSLVAGAVLLLTFSLFAL